MTVICKKSGFTIVELLTVLVIIMLLTGILIPSLYKVRNIAKEAKQRAQFASIDQALLAFRNYYGDYPGSAPVDSVGNFYNGAMKLTEALVGYDLLGCHTDFSFLASGVSYNAGDPNNLDKRVGPFLDVSTSNAFTLPQIFGGSALFDPNNHVLCDSFPRIKVSLGSGRTVKAGLPVLYYKANTSSKTMINATLAFNIYNSNDNLALISEKDAADGDSSVDPIITGWFYDVRYKVIDPQATAAGGIKWPYRHDSYILISAGADGEYGTDDDITNVGQ